MIELQHPSDCQSCGLCKEGRRQVVQSVLPEGAQVLFIGEGPGENEDAQGIPFAEPGPSAKLLNEVFREVGIDRSQVAIANAVCCRPADNDKPSKKEIDACWEYLDAEIKLLQPKLIVPLGDTAFRKVLPHVGGITKCHGQWFTCEEYNCKVIPLYHPSFVTRDPINNRSKFVKGMSVVADFIHGRVTEHKSQPTFYHTVENMKQLDWLVEQLHKEPEWACDTETSGFDFLRDDVFIITFSWREYTAVLLDFRKFSEEHQGVIWNKLKGVFENRSKKIFHNGPFDIEFFLKYSINLRNYYADTILMHFLLNENVQHGLEALAWEMTDKGGYEIPLTRYKTQFKIDDYRNIPPEIIYPYAQTDADVTFRCYKKMMPRIYEEALDFVFFNVMMPASKMLIKTEYDGVSIDVPHLKRTIVKYQKKMDDALEIVYNTPQVIEFTKDRRQKILDELRINYEAKINLQRRFPDFDTYVASRKKEEIEFQFNINSHPQLKELLLDRMQLKVIKFTKKGRQETKNPSFDAEVLEQYAKQNKFCASLSEYRTLTHLKSTFLDGIEKKLDGSNRVHTDYRLFVAVTGRPSSSDPNLNNIPRTGTAEDIKDIFCADPGQWLMEVDGAQAEFRMWINYSQDLQALRDLDAGYDIHKLVAAMGKGVTVPRRNLTREEYLEIIKDVTKAERQAAKNVVFGLMYGRGAESVAEQLGITKRAAQAIIDAFFGRYPQARIWLQRIVSRARRDGYVLNLFGRRRRLLDINSRMTNLRAEAERQAMNSPIQGGASDLTFLAGIRIASHLWSHHMQTRLVLTVYDSLVYTIPDQELQFMAKFAYEEVKKKPIQGIVVPLEAEVKVGKNWGSLLEINLNEDWSITYSKIKKHVADLEMSRRAA